MSKSTLRSLALVVATSVGVSATAMGQDNIARTYSITPKAGMRAQFEAALREHVQWRTANNDPDLERFRDGDRGELRNIRVPVGESFVGGL